MSKDIAPARGPDLSLTGDKFERAHLERWADEVETDTKPILRMAHMVFLVIFVFGGFWAALAPLGGAIVTSGRVIAEGRNRIIQHLEGGILKELLVREGDKVKAGQIVARLDDTLLSAQMRSSRLQRALLRIQLARWRAEASERTDIQFPADLHQNIIDHPRVLEAIAGQQDEFNAQFKFRVVGNEIIDTQIKGQRGDILGLRSVLVAMDRQLELYELELKDYQDLLASGRIDRPRVFATERQVVELRARVARTNLDIRAAENNIETLINQKRQDRLAFLQAANKAVIDLQQQLNSIDGSIERLEDMLDRGDIRSPENGTVFKIAKRTLGAVLRPGDALMEIFPDEDGLTIEGKLEVRHIEKVFVGQEIAVVFPSSRAKAVLQFPGTLTYVSPDVVISENNPMGSYVIQVRVDDAAQIDDMVPGNTAQIFIKTKPQTFVDILVGPIRRFGLEAFND
jgi:membrane fusion protein, type I secretion system